MNLAAMHSTVNRASRTLLLVILIGAGSASAQSNDKVSRGSTIATVQPDSYAVYSAVINQHYRGSVRGATPLNIAAYTSGPDHNHGNLMARCTSGVSSAIEHQLIGELFSAALPRQKLEAKLTISERYSIVEGKIDIREGSWPGFLWFSPVVFSRDRLHAIVWVRNFCGGLCGSGLVWKLNRISGAWRVYGSVPNCGFIS